jgi:2OG-Fe(II) oxygenase superfamily
MKLDIKHLEIPKLGPTGCEEINKIEYVNHGTGIMQFKSVIDVPQSKVLPYIDEYSYVPSCGLEIYEENGVKKARDFEGNEQPYENLLALPLRLGGFGMPGPVEDYTDPDIVKFFNDCERALYLCLMRYIDIHPLILNTIWWKGRGHVLKYLPGASLGMHNDNDTNFRVIDGQRYFSQREVAMYQVVNAIIYFNDSYDGGEFRFPYADVTIKPNTGDIVFFPANYIGTHAVAPIRSGERYTYLAQFGHGVAKNDEVREAQESVDWLPPVYLPFVYQDAEKFSKSGYSHFDDSTERALGLHNNTVISQCRSVEGAPTGTKIPYEED